MTLLMVAGARAELRAARGLRPADNVRKDGPHVWIVWKRQIKSGNGSGPGVSKVQLVGRMQRPYRAHTVGRGKRMDMEDTRIPRMVMRLNAMVGGDMRRMAMDHFRTHRSSPPLSQLPLSLPLSQLPLSLSLPLSLPLSQLLSQLPLSRPLQRQRVRANRRNLP